MSHRLNIPQRQFILREMLELARFLTVQGVPPPHIKEAVGQLKDDLLKLIRAGVSSITVDCASYLEPFPDRQRGEAP